MDSVDVLPAEAHILLEEDDIRPKEAHTLPMEASILPAVAHTLLTGRCSSREGSTVFHLA